MCDLGTIAITHSAWALILMKFIFSERSWHALQQYTVLSTRHRFRCIYWYNSHKFYTRHSTIETTLNADQMFTVAGGPHILFNVEWHIFVCLRLRVHYRPVAISQWEWSDHIDLIHTHTHTLRGGTAVNMRLQIKQHHPHSIPTNSSQQHNTQWGENTTTHQQFIMSTEMYHKTTPARTTNRMMMCEAYITV